MALFLTEADVARLADMPMALDSTRRVMAAFGRGEALNVPRHRLAGPSMGLNMLQGYVPDAGVMGFKVYSISKGQTRFHVHLYDERDGHLMAILEAAHLSALRTGAASGVATDALAHPHARVLGVFGSGRQAAAQIEAVCRVRGIREVKVHSRRADACAAFCRELSSTLALDVRPARGPADVVRGSQIVTTITSSQTPLFDGDWLEPGTHINAAGANMLTKRELDEKALLRCAVVAVDSREVARLEAGDLLPLIEQGRLAWSEVSELGEILTARRPSRARPEDITCYESFGMAIQDLALGARIVQRAREQGVGLELPIGV